MKKKKIVVIGGGTGTFTVLSGLKKYPVDLSAVVAMSDDGGSTGILRDELGVLPPGDIRQCLVALSESPLFLRELMNYRFAEGKLSGHSFGNLLLSALEKMTGSFDEAVARAGRILRIHGNVIPATLDKVNLAAHFTNGKVLRGQHKIQNAPLAMLSHLFLEPRAMANPKALAAIREADLITIGPGDIYSSLIPNLLVRGIPEAIRKSRAKKIYIVNLMTKLGQTEGFSVTDYARTIEHYLGEQFDHVIYNTKHPSPSLLAHYAGEGEHFVEIPKELPKTRFIGADLVNKKIFKTQKGDTLVRTLIRHDSDRLAHIVMPLARKR